MPSAALYKDEGVSDFTLKAALRMLEAHGIDCDCINALDVLNGALENCDLFVMPGGADEPFQAKLGDAGAALIRDFVIRDGGSYLGLCAGAYYACDRFEFNKGHSSEICRDRPLKLFKGWAKGSLEELAPLYDLSLDTACVCELDVNGGDSAQIYYHGGPVFSGFEQDTGVEVLASYRALPANMNAAILYKKFQGSGGRVILSGPHFEVDADDFDKRRSMESNPQDFVNIYNDLNEFVTGREQLTEKILSLLLP